MPQAKGKSGINWRKALLFLLISFVILPLIAFAILYVPPSGWTSNDITTGKHPGYPNLVSHIYDMSVDNTTMFASEAARRSGWAVKRTDVQAGAVEAVATIVPLLSESEIEVTITPSPDNPRHSVATIRSHSRMGGGDLGANAYHIRTLQAAMDDKLPLVR